jgi:plasmid stability protein
MVTITIRNLDAAAIEKLKARAAEHGHSLEAELRAVLAREAERATRAELRATADRIARAGIRPVARSESTDLVREDRER